jgi:hypothetical protein
MLWSGEDGFMGSSPRTIQPLKMIPCDTVGYRREMGYDKDRQADSDTLEWREDVGSQLQESEQDHDHQESQRQKS